ncbi:MAG: EamA family transporter [Rikenellaceae bacterium]|nr:EamA family transporter [Rikenellaceae bacterium]MBQ5678883.1 EamA family transporter [Rikenellaceae bacterium]
MQKLKGTIWALVSSLTFGLIPLFSMPVLASGVGLDSLCFYRFAFAAVAMGAYMLLSGRSLRISPRELATVALLSVFYGSTSMFLTSSYEFIPSGIATTIHFLYPVLVTTIMIVGFGERASWCIFAAAAMAIGGVYLLSGATNGATIQLRGIVAVLITVVTYATYIVGVNRSAVKDMEGRKMTFYVLLCSAILFYMNLVVRHGGAIDPIPNAGAWVRLLLLALLPTLLSDLALIYAIQMVGSTTTAILGCMEPLTAVVIGIVCFGERFGATQAVGVVVVLAAVTLVIMAERWGRKSLRELLGLAQGEK